MLPELGLLKVHTREFNMPMGERTSRVFGVSMFVCFVNTAPEL